MCFSVNWGEKVSTPKGTREGYEFVAWFKDSKLTSVYSDATELNDGTVPEEPAYDKTVDMTDTIDKWGNIIDEDTAFNSDVDRDWIVRKLDLYGKWRKVIEGADGIHVTYVVGDLGKEETKPIDPLLYKDEAGAIGAGACQVNDANKDKYQFLYWVVQKWNATTEEYEDALSESGEPIICYPGDSFTVKLDYSKADIHASHVNPESGHTVIDSADYTMQLRAEYGLKKPATDTHFNFYRNFDGDNAEVADKALLHEDKNLQINQAVDIYTLTEGNDIPTRKGFEFLGWARKIEKTSSEGAITYSYPDLTEDDLYIRWVEAVPASEGQDAVPAHYEAKDKNGVWKHVTQVAADEALPYQAYYAVWGEKFFYIYHSATGKLEAVSMADTNKDDQYDLTKKVTNNYLYGGYYSDCGGVPAGGINPNVKKAASSNKTDKQVAIDGATVYAAQGLKNGDSRFWVREKAAKASRVTKGANGAESVSPAAAGNGDKVTPVADDVFYIKEVPSYYLQTNARWVYDWADGYKIKNIYMLTTMDDSLYSELGYVVVEANKSARIVSKFSYQQRNSDTVTTVTVFDLIGSDKKMGYIGVVDATSYIDSIKAGNVKMLPYWKTIDNVTVKTDGYRFWSSDTSKLTTGTIKYAPNQANG